MLCNCNLGIGNTGVPGCVSLFDITRSGFFMYTYASDGTRNSIALGDVVDGAYITARINDPDPSKRWYPTLKLSMVEDVRADPQTQDIDGVAYITKEGIRTFKAQGIRQSHVYMAKIKGIECGQISVFCGDAQNRLSGRVSEDGTEFYPHMIEQGTAHVTFVKPTSTTAQSVNIAWTYSELERDEDLDLYETTADFAGIAATGGLLDAYAAVSAISTTGFAAKITHEYGTANNPGTVRGLKLADFSLYNVTDAASVAITSVTETPAGNYVFVIPAQTSADQLRLTAVKKGVYLLEEFLIP